MNTLFYLAASMKFRLNGNTHFDIDPYLVNASFIAPFESVKYLILRMKWTHSAPNWNSRQIITVHLTHRDILVARCVWQITWLKQ